MTRGFTIKESLDAGKYFRVEIPGWVSGWDTHAESPALAALQVGCAHLMWGFNPLPLSVQVFKHHPKSKIGAAYLEEDCGFHPSLTADHYDI